MTEEYKDAQGNVRDLAAEEDGFKQRRWHFRVEPLVKSPALSDDPKIKPLYRALARKDGEATARFKADGDTAEQARAKLLDTMFDEVSLTDR